jgi:hypothetical protein
VVDIASPQQVELGVRNQTLSRQETVKQQFGKRCLVGVLLAAIVDECQCNAYSIVRRARPEAVDVLDRERSPTSTPQAGRPGFDDSALGSFHSSRRVTQFLQWAVPPPLARVTQAERRELHLAVSRRLRAALCARSSNSA